MAQSRRAGVPDVRPGGGTVGEGGIGRVFYGATALVSPRRAAERCGGARRKTRSAAQRGETPLVLACAFTSGSSRDWFNLR